MLAPKIFLLDLFGEFSTRAALLYLDNGWWGHLGAGFWYCMRNATFLLKLSPASILCCRNMTHPWYSFLLHDSFPISTLCAPAPLKSSYSYPIHEYPLFTKLQLVSSRDLFPGCLGLDMYWFLAWRRFHAPRESAPIVARIKTFHRTAIPISLTTFNDSSVILYQLPSYHVGIVTLGCQLRPNSQRS